MIVFITKMDPDRGQITGRLDDAKLQNWVTMSHKNEEAKRSFLQVFIIVILQSWWSQSCCGCCVCNPLPPHLCLPQRNSVHVFHEFESRLKFHEGRVSPTSAGLRLKYYDDQIKLYKKQKHRMLHWCWSCVGFSGAPLKAGALTVDLEAASRAFDQMLAVPWIKEAVKNWDSAPSLFIAQKYFTVTPDLFQYKPIACTPCHRKGLFPVQVNLRILCELLVRSRTTLKSPEIILILLTCPLLQENAMKEVLELAVVIAELSERSLTLLGTQRKQKDKLTSRNVGCSFSSFPKTYSTSFLKMEVEPLPLYMPHKEADWLWNPM